MKYGAKHTETFCLFLHLLYILKLLDCDREWFDLGSHNIHDSLLGASHLDISEGISNYYETILDRLNKPKFEILYK